MRPAPAISAGPAAAPPAAPPASEWSFHRPPLPPRPLRHAMQPLHTLLRSDLAHPPPSPSPPPPLPFRHRSLRRIRFHSFLRLCLRPPPASSSPESSISVSDPIFTPSSPMAAMMLMGAMALPEPAVRFAGSSGVYAASVSDPFSTPSSSPSFAGQSAAVVTMNVKAPPEPAEWSAGISDGLRLVLLIPCRRLAGLDVDGLLPEVRLPEDFLAINARFGWMGALRCGLPACEKFFDASLMGCGTSLVDAEEDMLGLDDCWDAGDSPVCKFGSFSAEGVLGQWGLPAGSSPLDFAPLSLIHLPGMAPWILCFSFAAWVEMLLEFQRSVSPMGVVWGERVDEAAPFGFLVPPDYSGVLMFGFCWLSWSGPWLPGSRWLAAQSPGYCWWCAQCVRAGIG